MRNIRLPVKQASYIEKAVGLIGKKKPVNLFFKTRFGIHTFGVHFPIDIVILSNTHEVKTTATVKPNRLFFWNPLFDNVVELSEGTIKEKNIQIGDTIDFV